MLFYKKKNERDIIIDLTRFWMGQKLFSNNIEFRLIRYIHLNQIDNSSSDLNTSLIILCKMLYFNSSVVSQYIYLSIALSMAPLESSYGLKADRLNRDAKDPLWTPERIDDINRLSYFVMTIFNDKNISRINWFNSDDLNFFTILLKNPPIKRRYF